MCASLLHVALVTRHRTDSLFPCFWHDQGTFKEAFLKANDFWTQYEHDIKLMKDLGATSFRFSFEVCTWH